MNVKPYAVAFVAAAAGFAGCGGHSSSTRLTIENLDRSGIHAYRLECDPPAGTIANAAMICGELRRHPNLLADVPAIPHSCPAGSNAAVQVTGTYRGHSVKASFPGSYCSWVLGPDELGSWSYLLAHAGPGTPEREFKAVPVSDSERKRGQRSRQEILQLIRERKASGSTRLDRQALRIIRELTENGWPMGGPAVAEADVYATSLRKADRALGGESLEPNRPVFVVLYHYTYRDYTGRRHRGRTGLSVLDARTLAPASFGLGGASLRGLGHPVTLTF